MVMKKESLENSNLKVVISGQRNIKSKQPYKSWASLSYLNPTTEGFIIGRKKYNSIIVIISRKCRNLENKNWLEQPS